MRKTAVAIALVLVATLGILVPSVAAATGDPKVVIIVGATHGATDGYRADADRAYAEAKKYTPNVVKVYSPNATWAKVKAAVAGASVVIYMGHGNGWPSPYTYDPMYTTKDGMGLNATAGNGDYNNKYYGEPYMAQLDLAPGAIVLLHHLCYASGNSEPGDADAERRRSPASAPTTTPRASSRPAPRRSSPTATRAPRPTCGRSSRPTSRSRTCGGRCRTTTTTSCRSRPRGRQARLVYQDPTRPTSGFYRSLAVGTVGVTTDEIVSAGYGDTGVDPTSLVVPGQRRRRDRRRDPVQRPRHRGRLGRRPCRPGRACASSSSRSRSPPTGGTLVEVEGIDDPSITGFMLATDLAAKDSTAPIVRVLDPGGPFSPNGDASHDTASIRGRFTESVDWKLRVRNGGGTTVFETTGTGLDASRSPGTAWSAATPVPDGTYTVSLTGDDAWDNGDATATRQLVVDTQSARSRGAHPGREHEPLVLAERRRRPRHGQPDGHERRDRRARHPRRRRRRARRQDLDDPERQRRRGDDLERQDERGRGRPRRRLHHQGRPAGSRRQHRRASSTAQVMLVGALRSVATSRTPVLPAGPRHARQDDDAVVHAVAPDDRHLDDPSTPRARSSSPTSTTSRCRPGPSRGCSTDAPPTARCCRAAATPRS